MAKKSNKILSGNGWSFEPAGRAETAETPSLPDAEQKATIKLEKRPKGKEVTTVSGFVLASADRKALAQALRKACGTGGADSPAGVEVQGDHRDKVRAYLVAKGWRVK